MRKVDRALLQRYGIEVEYFSAARDALEPLIRPNTRLLYLESPSSLLYEVLDLPALAAVARRHGVLVAADNTWSGGLYYQPLALGAHISLQAATKYLAGHSDVMMGVVTVDGPDLARQLGATADALGLAVGADDAYLTLRGLRTLDVRLARHHENALAVAEYLAGQPDVARVGATRRSRKTPAMNCGGATTAARAGWCRSPSGIRSRPRPHFIDALRYFDRRVLGRL